MAAKQSNYISLHFSWSVVVLLVGITAASASAYDISGAVTLANCSIADLHELLQPQRVETLSVSNCHISSLAAGDLHAYRSLETLQLTDSGLQQLADQSLYGLQQLRTLSLARNNISAVTAAWSGQVLKALSALDLQQNAIASLYTDSFVNYVNLQRLDLAHNALTQLPEGVFRPLTQLKQLNLGHNRLTHIDAATFRGVPHVMYLALHSNEIANITADAFATNLYLRSLRLDGNRLVSLAFLQCATLSRLVQLNVSQNAIVSLEPVAALKQADLTYLDVSHNRIEELPERALRQLALLERLNLSGNALQHIAPLSLAGLISLERIDLSCNRLTQLPADFSRITHLLQHVNVSHNALTSLPVSAFTDLPFLHTLDLSGNRLRSADANTLIAALTPHVKRNELTLLLCDNELAQLDVTALRPFRRVELAGNRWDCRWLIREMMHVPRSISFGRNYTVATAWSDDALLNATGMHCYSADASGALQPTVIVVVDTQRVWQPDGTTSATSPAANCNNILQPMYNASLPAPWPKLRLNRFDSRSVILWMLFGIAVAFAGLRLGRRLVDRKEHKRVVFELRTKQQALDKRQLIRHSSRASDNGQV